MKTFALFVLLACLPCCFAQPDTYLIDAGDWSAPVSDKLRTLRGRLLVSHPAPQTETEKSLELWNGARVYLELQNVSRVTDPIEIFIPGYLPMNCEMRDGHDKLLIGYEVWQLPDGPRPPQFTVTLPGDSTLRMPANTLIGTRHSDVWIIGLPQRSWEIHIGGTNEYFLSATFSPPTNHPSALGYHVWQGTLNLPKVKIDVALSSRHLTEAQVRAIAKTVLPLPAGESYYVHFSDGIWKVWTSPDGSVKGGWGATTVLTIQDSDGKVLGTTTNL